jgi:phage terminase large subunit
VTKKVKVHDDVFNPVYIPYLDCNSRTQIFYGGSGSGKSVFLAQRTVLDILRGGRNYLICRAVARTLRGSVFTEIVKIIGEWGLGSLFNVNRSDMLITCSNGYQIIFAGLDDVEKLKSITAARGVVTDIWVEEATEIDFDDMKQLIKRQRGGDEGTKKRLVLSFNPILQSHWIYQEYFKQIAWADDQREYRGEDLAILKTWYIHNQFLTKDDVHDYEAERDPYYRAVYTLGNWGVLGNVIFRNWSVEDLSGMRNQFTNRRIGLDFGFSSDPAAVAVTHYDRMHKIVYIFDELYETGLTNDMLASEIRPMVGDDPVVCDSAEPKSIAELRRHGIKAHAAKKGKDSVLYGIQWLQQQKVVIDPSCINARNEFQLYKWREDKDGTAMRQPVDHNNHLIDALRYAYESEQKGEPRKAGSRQG